MSVRVYSVPAGEVDHLFDVGGQLFGFSRTRNSPEPIHSARAQALRAALGHDRDLAVGILPDGRLAALDYLVSGPYKCAIEEEA